MFRVRCTPFVLLVVALATTPRADAQEIRSLSSSQPSLSFQTGAASSGGKWTGGRGARSLIDDSQTVVFRLDAESEFAGWLGRHRATLIVRCQENRTAVFIQTGTAASVESGDLDRHTVQIRLDDGVAFSQKWSESTNNEALFAPSPIPLARQIVDTDRMVVRFTPFNANPATLVFDVRGFDQHVGQVAETCHWSVEPTPPPPPPPTNAIAGMTKRQVRQRFGSPTLGGPNVWHYDTPGGSVSLTFEGDSVWRVQPPDAVLPEPAASTADPAPAETPESIDDVAPNTLLGVGKATLRQRFGNPYTESGGEWTYQTTNSSAPDGQIHLNLDGDMVSSVRLGRTVFPSELLGQTFPSELLGQTEEQIRQQFGSPSSTGRDMLYYDTPNGTLRIYLEAGLVTRIAPPDFDLDLLPKR